MERTIDQIDWYMIYEAIYDLSYLLEFILKDPKSYDISRILDPHILRIIHIYEYLQTRVTLEESQSLGTFINYFDKVLQFTEKSELFTTQVITGVLTDLHNRLEILIDSYEPLTMKCITYNQEKLKRLDQAIYTVMSSKLASFHQHGSLQSSDAQGRV